jgi:hypothetical protein
MEEKMMEPVKDASDLFGVRQLFGVRRPGAALVFGDLSPPSSKSTQDGCDRSQITKALTGQRTPN